MDKEQYREEILRNCKTNGLIVQELLLEIAWQLKRIADNQEGRHN